MTFHRATAAVTLLAWLAASGCTTLRDVPRSEFSQAGERKAVRILTRDSLEYEFDFARVSGDSITGFRRQDMGGALPDYAELSLALGDVERLSVRRVDWTRTGLVGGLGALVIASAGLAASKAGVGGGGNESGGGGGRVP